VIAWDGDLITANQTYRRDRKQRQKLACRDPSESVTEQLGGAGIGWYMVLVYV